MQCKLTTHLFHICWCIQQRQQQTVLYREAVPSHLSFDDSPGGVREDATLGRGQLPGFPSFVSTATPDGHPTTALMMSGQYSDGYLHDDYGMPSTTRSSLTDHAVTENEVSSSCLSSGTSFDQHHQQQQHPHLGMHPDDDLHLPDDITITR